MKRLTVFLIVAIFLLIAAGRGEAADQIHMYVSQETVATDGSRCDNAVATTTIIPGKHFIIGFAVTGNGPDCVDPTVELYDAATTAAMSATTIFDGREADTSPLRSEAVWYPIGKNISNGLAIRQGAHTTVVIYYERRVY